MEAVATGLRFPLLKRPQYGLVGGANKLKDKLTIPFRQNSFPCGNPSICSLISVRLIASHAFPLHIEHECLKA